MSGSSGVNLRLISCDESISAIISPNSDSVVWILALSAVNTSSSSLYKIISDIWTLPVFGSLTWIKNVA